MNKPFKTVSEYIRNKTKVVLAGIVFTLFSGVSSYALPATNFEKVENIFVEKSEVPASPKSDVKIELSFNAFTTETAGKMDDAFANFSHNEKEAYKLYDAFQEIRNGLSNITIDKLSIDGVPEKGTISFGILLPDGVVLSVNKRRGVHPKGVVGFNIIQDRELLVSDVLQLSALQSYILGIQGSDFS